MNYNENPENWVDPRIARGEVYPNREKVNPDGTSRFVKKTSVPLGPLREQWKEARSLDPSLPNFGKWLELTRAQRQ
jgi:hypothetical protein